MLKAFGKDLFIYGLSSSLVKFITLLLVPIYTRIFAPDVYGVMDLISSIVVITSILGMLQLESAVSRYYFAEKDEYVRKKLVSTAFWAIVLLSLLVFIIMSVFSNSISFLCFKNSNYSIVISIAALIIPVSNLNSFFTVIIRFKKKPLHYMFFQLAQIFATLGLTIFLTIYLKIGIVGVFWGQLLGYSISVLLMMVYLRNEVIFSWSFDSLKKMLYFSLPLVPSVIGGWINSYTNRFVMLGYLSLSEIGLYAVGLKIASVFLLIGSALRMALGPFLWETFENNPKHIEVFRKLQEHFSVFVLMFVAAFTLFSKEIVLILTNSMYLEASQIIGVLSLALTLSNIIDPLTSIGPAITNKTKYNTLVYFISLPVNIGLLFLLVPAFGILGVSVSLLLANLTLLIVGWYNSEKLYYIGFNKFSMFIYLMFCGIVILFNYYFNIALIVKLVILVLMLVYLIAKYYDFIFSFFNNLNFKKNNI